jgi:tRNA (guanine37-N1)-methyltransferase
MKLKKLLRSILTEKELEIAPSSFDVIGDIAITEIPKELEKKEKKIGEQLLKFKHIKTVLKKESKVENEFRLRKYKFLAGEDKRETLHIEYGCRFKLNLEKVYFSPRLANERDRIVKQVKENEKVLVMFAGIGPYAIQIAKRSDAKEVYAIEINPEAVKYMEENIRLNKVQDKIKIFAGDVHEIVPKLKEKFDRIVMPLPKGNENFLDLAKMVSKKDTIIHFYTFASSEEDAIKKINYKIKVLNCVRCGSYAKDLYRFCVDFIFM